MSNDLISQALTMDFQGIDEETEAWLDSTLVDVNEDRYKLKWTDDEDGEGESWASEVHHHVSQTHRQWEYDEDGTPLWECDEDGRVAETHLNHKVR